MNVIVRVIFPFSLHNTDGNPALKIFFHFSKVVAVISAGWQMFSFQDVKAQIRKENFWRYVSKLFNVLGIRIIKLIAQKLIKQNKENSCSPETTHVLLEMEWKYDGSGPTVPWMDEKGHMIQ